MKHICYISGTRADYGLMKPVLARIHENADFRLSLIVCGMHLDDRFGCTVRDIEADGYPIAAKVSFHTDDSLRSMAERNGHELLEFSKKLSRLSPDCLLVEGDRGEALMGAIAARYLNIPVAHQGGGDRSGSIDDRIRDAITAFSDLHFAGSRGSAKRLRLIARNPHLVFFTGEPGIDSIIDTPAESKESLFSRFELNLSQPLILVVQHPVTTQANEAGLQMRETLEAIRELKMQAMIVFPNSDTGDRAMIREIHRYTGMAGVRTSPSLIHKDYVNFLRHCDVLVGNTSSGIVEAPVFKKPFVNVGTRQKGREQACNVIPTPHRRKAIVRAVCHALNDALFRQRCSRVVHPYGNGTASRRILEVLSRVDLDKLNVYDG